MKKMIFAITIAVALCTVSFANAQDKGTGKANAQKAAPAVHNKVSASKAKDPQAKPVAVPAKKEAKTTKEIKAK